MTLCERGCGTELESRVSETIFGPIARGLFGPDGSVHTPERCQKATRALLDEARREREVDAIQIEQLKILANTCALEAAEKRAEDAVRSAKNAEAFIHLLDARAERTRSALEEVAYQMDVTYVRRCVYCNERKRDPHTVDCVIGLALAQYIDTPKTSAKTSKKTRHDRDDLTVGLVNDHCCQCGAAIDVAKGEYNTVCLSCDERPRAAKTEKEGP